MTADQKAVGIHTVGCAGHEGDLVLTGDDGELVGLGGENDKDLLDLVGEDFIQHVDGEGVALDDLVKVGEKPCARQAAMPGNDGMGGRTADGKAGALDMSGRNLKNALGGAVVNGQLHVDIGDGNIAHDAGAGDIEDVVIARNFVKIGKRCIERGELAVIVAGFGEHLVVLLVVKLGDRFLVAGNDMGRHVLVPPIGEGRIEHHGESHEEQNCKNNGGKRDFLLHESLPNAPSPEGGESGVSGLWSDIRELLLVLGALLGHEDNACANHENAANSVEQDGAHAAGGGECCALCVLNSHGNNT